VDQFMVSVLGKSGSVYDERKQPFNSPSFFIQYRIEPARSSPLRMYPGSRVGWDVAFDSSFPVVLADLLGIVGCIRRDD